jgi:hypothetical protein
MNMVCCYRTCQKQQLFNVGLEIVAYEMYELGTKQGICF